MHHKLLCSSSSSHAVSTSEVPKGEDDEKDDKGKKKKSKKKNKKPASNSSLGPISYENSESLKHAKKNPDMRIFADRLLLLVHSLLSLSDGSPSQALRTK